MAVIFRLFGESRLLDRFKINGLSLQLTVKVRACERARLSIIYRTYMVGRALDRLNGLRFSLVINELSSLIVESRVRACSSILYRNGIDGLSMQLVRLSILDLDSMQGINVFEINL